MTDINLQKKKLQVFTPTAEMKRWLSTSFELGYGSTITDIAKESGVTRQSWYNWVENSDFVKWFDSMWQKHLVTMRWRLDAMGMKQSERNYEYWRDMMVRVGNLPAEGPKVAIQQNIGQIMEKELKDDDIDTIAGELPQEI